MSQPKKIFLSTDMHDNFEVCIMIDMSGYSEEIMEFKNGLRSKVGYRGGLAELSRRTGMKESSLSRFFSTPAMPKKSTLERIGVALGFAKDDPQIRFWLHDELTPHEFGDDT